MKNSVNRSMQFHPVVYMMIGLVLGLVALLLGWHTWLDDAMDIYEAVHEAPLSFLRSMGKEIICGLGLRAD